MNLDSIHDWLRCALPATADELLSDLLKLHKALPKCYAGFPQSAAELSEVMRTLEGMRLVRKEGAEWKWLSGEAVPKQEALLF